MFSSIQTSIHSVSCLKIYTQSFVLMSKIYTLFFVLMFSCLKYTPCLSCPLVLLSKPPSPINFSLYHSKHIMIFLVCPKKSQMCQYSRILSIISSIRAATLSSSTLYLPCSLPAPNVNVPARRASGRLAAAW